jgi:MFS transporter, DHA1 family, multidrug resistance protein
MRDPFIRWIEGLRSHERVFALSVSTALMMTGQGMAGPVLPVFARRFGVSLAAVGMTVAAFGLARLLLNIPLGSLADRRGRRILLVGGPFVFAVSMVGAGLAGDIVALTVWRFLTGAGSAMYMTGALVYLTDISTTANRGRLIGTNQAALLFGQAIGPGLGGLLADQLGIRAPFFVIAGAGVAATVYGYFRLEETRPQTGRPAGSPGGAGVSPRWRTVLGSRSFLAIALVNFAVFFTRASSNNTLMPLKGVGVLGLTLGEMGLIMTGIALISLALLPVAANISDRHGRVIAIAPSLLGTATALVIIALSADVSWFVVGAGVLALSTAISGPAPAAFAADNAPEAIRGVTLGMFRTAGDLGLLVGPPLLGWIADIGGFTAAFGVNAVLVAGVSILFFISGRSTRRAAA